MTGSVRHGAAGTERTPAEGRRRIAVVDDNHDSLLLMRRILETDAALDVEVFDRGADALLRFATDLPDLVLADISMPGFNGLDLLAGIRALPGAATLPVIAVTAHAMVGDESELRQAGFSGYLSKPIVDDEALHAMIRHHLPSR